ncbi:MAG: type II toxin-antitoxin system VapC family toxin [Verrucomicrobia bacterium]|nr:type II toxin-antitoxin system VapC family toxin [Verrucomicrobiota bacterium]
MNVVASSGWLAYFADELNAKRFEPALQNSSLLVVPVVILYEVYKVLLRESGEDAALQASAAMQKGTVVAVTPQLAVEAARLSLEHTLPMADSLILATARAASATIWTQDEHFKDIAGVKYFPKK